MSIQCGHDKPVSPQSNGSGSAAVPHSLEMRLDAGDGATIDAQVRASDKRSSLRSQKNYG